MSDVFDSSALLAFLFREPGGEVVGPRLAGASVSTLNVAEVVAKLVDRGFDDQSALALWSELAMNAVSFDLDQAKETGLLRRQTVGAGLSQADRACLNLAARLGATAVTADQIWSTLDLGIELELIR